MRRAAAAVVALALAACGAGGAAPDPSAFAASKVNDCIKAHGLSGPSDRIDPPAPTIRGTSTTVFRSCDWPASYIQTGRYAVTDGYAEIRVTREPWPGKAEVTNASAPDRIEAPCAVVELRYTFSKQGPPSLQAPVRFAAATHTMITGQPFTEDLPFPVAERDVVVVHNLSYSIVSARCVL